jgi:2-desacetyl-2-hydroxyethyl bacteriochlorophyllide A dehydrogenase
MKQIVLRSPGVLDIQEAPVPQPAPGEALLRMERVGVCGSDFHAFHGRQPAYTYPRILGHELSGTVIEISHNTRGIELGDRCAIEPYISCGLCRVCLRGRTNCCEQLRVLGVHVDGGMQEFLSVPIALLHKSSMLSLDQLALVEMLGIGAHAIARSGLQNGEEAMVIGAGPIGLSVAQFAHAAGARVSVIERSESRRRFVEELSFLAQETPGERVADVVFDATGSAAAMSASLAQVATGGKLVYVGLTADLVPINDAILHKREVTIIASRNSAGQFARIIQMIESGTIDTAQWITDRMGLSQVPAQMRELALRASLIKAIVDVQQTRI